MLGTVSVFDAARAAGAKLVYASSIAALAEGTLYGTWKRANEGTAAAFWAEDGFPSIGLRPALVYGVGRDRGVTASMTLAMAAAARGEPFHIVHGGSVAAESRRRRGAVVRPRRACRLGGRARLRHRRPGARRGRGRGRDRGGRARSADLLRGHARSATPPASTAARSRRRWGRSSGGRSSRACRRRSTASESSSVPRVAIVTGGAGGFGRAIVQRLREDALEVVAGDLPGLDVTDPDSVDAFVADVLERHGRLDVLVNNAGIAGSTAPVDDYAARRVAPGARREPDRHVHLHPPLRPAHAVGAATAGSSTSRRSRARRATRRCQRIRPPRPG